MWPSITRQTCTFISLQKHCNVSLNYDCDFIRYTITNPLSLTWSWAYLFPWVDGFVWASKASVKNTLLILLYCRILSMVDNHQDKLLSAWILQNCLLLSMDLLASSSYTTQILLNWILLTPFTRVSLTALMLASTWATASRLLLVPPIGPWLDQKKIHRVYHF